MKIYTKTGDAGDTGLFGGPRVPKDSPRIEAYGTVDELNAVLGAARAELLPGDINALLARIQSELFDVGAELATPEPQRHGTALIAAGQIAALEAAIDRFEASLAPLKQFILPGGAQGAAALHVARTVCRRAERRVVTLAHVPGETISGGMIVYLNRLGDLLFVLARAANAAAGQADVPWAESESRIGIEVAARSFRMYGKKRGHRRTGSNSWGSLGEAVVFAFFLGVGTVFLVLLLRMPVLPEWRANHDFVQTTGTVIDKRVAETPGKYGTSYRAEIDVHYKVNDQPYEKWTYDITFNSDWEFSSNRESRQAQIESFEVFHPCPVWYDPQDPATVVVVRGYSGWLWSLLLLPLSFIVIGGVGLIYALLHWGKSPEHLAAASQLAARLEIFEESTPRARDYPHVPRDANLTNSPGTRLRYRLPINTMHGWKLLAAAAVCLCWNGIVVAFIVMALRREKIDWWLLLFTAPFLFVGLGMIYFMIRQLLIATGLGPTQLEISDHPLLPGRHYDLFLSQSGRLMMNSLEIDLACDEQATYRQGTDTRTEQRRVYQRRVFERRKFDIPQGMPFEHQFRIEIPADAMHSFRSDHNELQWKFVVRGEVTGWPKYERSFPIIVFPKPPPRQ